METSFRIALTADLHWGINTAGDAGTRQLVEFVRSVEPQLLILAGDIGTQNHFGECLNLFGNFTCRKALVPGNHDIWVQSTDPRGDSLFLYDELLPRISRENGFHYLDQQPLLVPEHDLAVAGSMNWYDYSWSLDQLKSATADWEYRLSRKQFSRGRHNDANFVRWAFSDVDFTRQAVATFQTHLAETLSVVKQTLVVTHHPCLRTLNFPRREPQTLDGLLWEAFSGNRALEETILANQDRIPFAFSGHTHRAREERIGPIRGFNIGGDYHFKRLLLLDWPGGNIEAHEFHG